MCDYLLQRLIDEHQQRVPCGGGGKNNRGIRTLEFAAFSGTSLLVSIKHDVVQTAGIRRIFIYLFLNLIFLLPRSRSAKVKESVCDQKVSVSGDRSGRRQGQNSLRRLTPRFRSAAARRRGFPGSLSSPSLSRRKASYPAKNPLRGVFRSPQKAATEKTGREIRLIGNKAGITSC